MKICPKCGNNADASNVGKNPKNMPCHPALTASEREEMHAPVSVTPEEKKVTEKRR